MTGNLPSPADHPMQPGSPHAARKRCGAANRDGSPCKNWAMSNGRCRMHGGKSLAGPASPTFKTGRYSRHMPARLADRLAQALDDPDYLNLHEEIALLEVQIGEALERLHNGAGGSIRDVLKAWDALKRVSTRGDRKAWQERFTDLGVAIDALTAEDAARETLIDLINQKRLVSETERKRQVQMRQLVTVEQAMTLVAVVHESVKRHVKDPDTLRAIQIDLTTAMNHGGAR